MIAHSPGPRLRHAAASHRNLRSRRSREPGSANRRTAGLKADGRWKRRESAGARRGRSHALAGANRRGCAPSPDWRCGRERKRPVRRYRGVLRVTCSRPRSPSTRNATICAKASSSQRRLTATKRYSPGPELFFRPSARCVRDLPARWSSACADRRAARARLAARYAARTAPRQVARESRVAQGPRLRSYRCKRRVPLGSITTEWGFGSCVEVRVLGQVLKRPEFAIQTLAVPWGERAQS